MEHSDETIQREVRQLRLMVHTLRRFAADEIGVGKTIGNLEGLLGQLQITNGP